MIDEVSTFHSLLLLMQKRIQLFFQMEIFNELHHAGEFVLQCFVQLLECCQFFIERCYLGSLLLHRFHKVGIIVVDLIQTFADSMILVAVVLNLSFQFGVLVFQGYLIGNAVIERPEVMIELLQLTREISLVVFERSGRILNGSL